MFVKFMELTTPTGSKVERRIISEEEGCYFYTNKKDAERGTENIRIAFSEELGWHEIDLKLKPAFRFKNFRIKKVWKVFHYHVKLEGELC